MSDQVPDVVISRLPLYVRVLDNLVRNRVRMISSREFGAHVQMTPAQIRKDLSYFGRFGSQGRGYDVAYLLGELRKILGLDREWPMALVGVGQLGRAVISYEGFATEGFRVVVAFDTDPRKSGEKVGPLVVRHIDEMETFIRQHNIVIGIVAVPAKDVQDAVDRLVRAGVMAILNYASLAARVPESVRQRVVDPVLALQTMTYHLK
ncbi:MAG: redox-sensing transcriptional repressor Rex [Chloroflexota bacterium]